MADPAAGSYAQRLEARRVETSAGVVAGSLDLLVVDEGDVLEFDIASEPTVNAPAADVRDVERICFVYKHGRRFGETAPSHVLCKREDFPRDLVHLCSTGPGGLAAPCLALAGLQPLYERVGIEAVMERLRKFLRDAKTGTLTADGWEPVPFGIDQVPIGGEVIPHFLQDHAHANLGNGRALGVAINIERDQRRFVAVFPEILAPHQIAEGLAFRNSNAGNKRVGIPWVFLWPTTIAAEGDPIFDDWRTGAELLDGMKRIGVGGAFDAAVGDLLERGIDFRCEREPTGGKAMVVVLGVWRPEPIMREFFGYSEDAEARRLELRAFRVSQDLGKDIVALDTRVETIVGDYPASPELFRWVAGVDRTPPVALIGAGAIGSAILNHLARSGLDDALVIDHDRLRPHNLTRHAARADDLYAPKGEAASGLMHGLIRDMSLKFDSVESDVVDMAIEELVASVEGRLVIDATADERVRLRMDELRSHVRVTIVRTEMFHEGQLGATFVVPPEGPALADMMRMLIASAPDDQHVAAWLEHEEMNPLGPDPLLAGFGCTSQTIHLPLHAVEQHASVATAAILGNRANAGVALNPVDGGYRPTGWSWLPVAPFTILVPPTESDWTVKLSGPALDRIRSVRLEALPSETGGYLYGAWDPVLRTIIVTTATALPPGSTASASSLQLGPAGATLEERRLRLKTRGRIYLVGTWHSHPGGSASMSGRDYTTMMDHHARDAVTLSPTLVVIAAHDELKAHLKLP
jgi:molybdopterin/thiamine biosynthesis adenylyltransferase